MFTEWELPERFALAAEHGFEAVELTLPYDCAPERLARAREQTGLDVIVFACPLGDFIDGGEGIAAVPGKQIAFRDSLTRALEYAQALDARMVHVVAGRCAEQAHHAEKRKRYLQTLVDNLNEAGALFARHDIEIALEAVNTRDYPDYLISTPEQLWHLVERLETPVAPILDTLHACVMGIDPVEEIRHNGHRYGHLQLADGPQRGAPGSGTLDFPAIYRAVTASDDRGYIGAEYPPGDRGTVESLDWMEDARRALC